MKSLFLPLILSVTMMLTFVIHRGVRGLSTATRASRNIMTRTPRSSFRSLRLYSTPQRDMRDLDNQERIMSLLNDLRGIVTSPGFTKTSIKRSIQVTKGFANVLQSYLQNKNQFLDENGSLSVPKTLRRVFEQLGATYIKLGQFIASSPTIFPADYVEEFQACLDKTPTVPYATIRQIIQDDLKRPLQSLYASIDPVPLASASIAQVHRATLKDGTEVVIKVRKPGVDSTLQADLAFLLVASKLIEFINPSISSLSLANIVSDIRDSMLDELDFRKEAKNLINFRDFLWKNNIVEATAPEPFLSYSSERVLTMEYLRGIPLVDLEGIKDIAKEPEMTLLAALRTWALTVATNDLFHADLHAGNLLVLRDGRIGFIDFGIVGKISEKFRKAVGDLFNAFVTDDYVGIAEALIAMGATRGNVNKEKFGAELRTVIENISNITPQVVVQSNAQTNTLEAQLQLDERETTDLVLQIVGVAEKNGLKLPREFGLVLKQTLYFDRYQKLLAPDMDPIRDVRVRSQLADQMRANNANNNNNNNINEKPRIFIDVEGQDITK